MRLILAALVPLSLAACQSTSMRSVVERPELAKIRASLKQACSSVVTIPDKALSSSETVRLWAEDRQSLGTCGRRHGALVRAIEAVEGQGR